MVIAGWIVIHLHGDRPLAFGEIESRGVLDLRSSDERRIHAVLSPEGVTNQLRPIVLHVIYRGGGHREPHDDLR